MSDHEHPSEDNSTTVQSSVTKKPRRRPWIRLILGLIFVGVAIAAAVILLQENRSPANTTETEELNFAEVVITDLFQEETFNGTLGSIEADPVRTQLGGTITDIPHPGDMVRQGEALYAIDDQPIVLLYGDTPAFRDITIGEDTVIVSGQLSGRITWVPEPGAVIQQGDILYRVDDKPVFALIGDQPAYRDLYGGYEVEVPANDPTTAIVEVAADGGSTFLEEFVLTGYDVRQLEEALVALGYDPDDTVVVDGEFNLATRWMVWRWQVDVGADVDWIVNLGEVVFLPGPAQVIEILVTPGDYTGGGVMMVATGDPASGTDVLQLETALVSLGFDVEGTLIADGVYTPETNQGVLAFQAATGLEQDGVVDLGEIVFLPGAVRVINQLSTSGSSVGEGSAILAISLTEKVVRIDLPADKQGLLTTGDPVIVEMPDNTEVPATVTFVSQTATPGQNEWEPATFEVLIEFDDPTVAEGLDEAPVDVIVLSDSVEDVMAIPVSALVALLEGGYAVEVDAGGGLTEYIAVEVGFFGESNLVEIISGELEPGYQVVVP
jgi:peptidoglycan hydrolase-like protein with peptidoglycan-binding domain